MEPRRPYTASPVLEIEVWCAASHSCRQRPLRTGKIAPRKLALSPTFSTNFDKHSYVSESQRDGRCACLSSMLPASLSALSLDATPPLILDLLALPHPLTLAIFALLPVDTRLRCSEVNRAWRALLADTSFWASLDASTTSGVAHFSEALFRAAVAKAGGQLRALDLTGQRENLLNNLLCDVVAANAATLFELRVDTYRYSSAAEVRVLLEASPAILLLQTSVMMHRGEFQLACAMLRNEPPFQALRLRRLLITDGVEESTADIFCSDLRGHTSLTELTLYYAALNTDAAMGAVVDACVALRLRRFELRWSRVLPAAVPQLTRLVAAGMLRELCVSNDGVEIFDDAHEEPTRLFVAAVRASALTSLELHFVGVLPETVVEAAAFINTRRH